MQACYDSTIHGGVMQEHQTIVASEMIQGKRRDADSHRASTFFLGSGGRCLIVCTYCAVLRCVGLALAASSGRAPTGEVLLRVFLSWLFPRARSWQVVDGALVGEYPNSRV